MIKQDFLLRMIEEIISLIVNMLLKKRKIQQKEWIEYDCLTKQILGFPTDKLLEISVQELIDRYEEDPNKMGKIELAAMTLLKMSDEEEANLLLKAKLRQDGLELLKYVQKESNQFSIQRVQLISVLETNS